MKSAKFEFSRVSSLEDAVKTLHSADGEIRVLGGGQSLGPMMNLRLAQPDEILDISVIDGLDDITAEKNVLRIGARVTHARIEDGNVPGVTGEYMRFVASGISYRSVRNRGTIGGSVAHADPAADWPAALLALGGDAMAIGNSGVRSIMLDEFQVGPFSTKLGQDEILTGFELPILSDDAKWGYYKVNRKPGEFADAIGAVTLTTEARVVCGANASMPFRVPELEQKISEGVNQMEVQEIREILSVHETNFDDYELQIHAVALGRAVERAFT